MPYGGSEWRWFNDSCCGASLLVLLLFYTLCVQFTSWKRLPESRPCLEFFSDEIPQDISWGQVLFKALSNLWLLRALQHLFYGFPAGLSGKEPTCNAGDFQKTQAQSLGWEEPLAEEMATHSSILTWRIPWTEEPGRLQSMGSQRVRHNWATKQQHLF